MKPVSFPESNTVIAKDQPEYLPLPAFLNKESQRCEMITCWKLSFFERMRILFTGKLWCCESTFHNNITPRLFSTKKWDVLNKRYFQNKKKNEKV